MHTQGRVRYVSSRLHTLTFPELWSPSLPIRESNFGSEQHIEVCRLKCILKLRGLTKDEELLDAIDEISHAGYKFRHEFRDMHPNTLFFFNMGKYYATPLCYVVEQAGIKLLRMMITESDTDVNLLGLGLPQNKYNMCTALEIAVFDACCGDIAERRQLIALLIRAGAVFSLGSQAKNNAPSSLKEFVDLCATREIRIEKLPENNQSDSSEDESDEE